MNNCRFALARRTLFGVTLLLAFSGCSTPLSHPKSASQDYAFITYWPPKEGNQGLRLAVKDMIDMKDTVTTAGSEYLLLADKPAKRDAKCLEGARARKVQFVGKTNLNEYGMGISGMNTYFGTPRNRMSRHIRLIPGGSSSGSAVAVANDWADVAFGTDTAGSIRVPAACCGVYGLKTTYGLVPLQGVFPLSPKHLDTVGPLAKDIPRLVQGMDLLQPGFEAQYRRAVAAKPTGQSIRIGRLYLEGTDPLIDRAIDAALIARGFQIVVLPLSFRERWEQATRNGQTIANGDIWLNHEQFLDKKGVSATTKTIITVGRLRADEDYLVAVAQKSAWQRALRNVLARVDFIAVPTMQKAPPAVPLMGSALFEARVFQLQNTVAVNYAGNPAIAIPIPIKARVPVTSLQLIGPPRSEAALVNAGRILEAQPQPQSQLATQ